MQPHRRRESLDPSEVCTLKRQRTDSELLEFVIQAANEGNVAEDHPIAESSSIAGNQANAGVSRPTHVCEICGRVFETKPRLKRHYITKHHGDKPYECSTCGERFPRKDYLARHLASYHSSASTTNPPEFLCTYPGCGREFRERALLNRHLESHSVNPSLCARSKIVVNILRGKSIYKIICGHIRGRNGSSARCARCGFCTRVRWAPTCDASTLNWTTMRNVRTADNSLTIPANATSI